ncbi:hypothetical protein RclHR1_06960003 [Rhizophagus clarus]|uniref:Uncharacterized protein n=1 Tax=Rhizophagus clarus TaxID=94130 RepID=A0A2Z6S6Y1_9GLOM|nr:hypothetical protein RclHR1_06960003 [Rhizophagus clarus]
MSLSQVKKIKFAIKNLYYEVAVTFANKDLAEALKEEWSIKFLNKTFRIFPSTLTKEGRNYHFKYVLKLTNLPKGINGENLLKIVTIDDMNAAKENHFAFNNKGLHFADKNTLTCHIAYQDIYKRYKVEALKPKSGFKPIFPPAKEDFIPSDINWTDNWDAKFSAKPTPPVRQNKTGFNLKFNHVFSKDIPFNIPQSQGIKQFKQRLYNLEKRLDKNVDSNVNSRLEKVEQQLNKFNNLMKKFNDRIVNLEMHMLNQLYNKPDLDLNFSPVTDSFVNVFNKRSRIEKDVSDIIRTPNPQLSNFLTQKNTLSSDVNMQVSQDESIISQDFYQDAMEHNRNPTVQHMDEMEDKVNNACFSLETMNNQLGQLIGLFFPFNAYLSQQGANPT